MGYDAEVTLVYGCRVPIFPPVKEGEVWDCSQMDKMIKKFFWETRDMEQEEFDDIYGDWLSVGRRIPGTEYTLQVYNHCGEDDCGFIQLKTVEMKVCRSSDPSPKEVEEPSEEEIERFKKFLRDENVEYPYKLHMVLSGSC